MTKGSRVGSWANKVLNYLYPTDVSHYIYTFLFLGYWTSYGYHKMQIIPYLYQIVGDTLRIIRGSRVGLLGQWGPYLFITLMYHIISVKLYFLVTYYQICTTNAHHSISIPNKGWYIENLSLGIARGEPGSILGQWGPYPLTTP